MKLKEFDLIMQFDISRINVEVYSEEEARAIHKSYLDVVKSLEETRAVIDALKKKEQALIREIEYHEAALAPHKRLPDDVLQQIYIQCANAYGRVTIPLFDNTVRPPQLVISHVCSSWRKLALNTGALWDNIRLTQLWKFEKHLDVSIAWLRRAGALPVSLELDIPELRYTPSFSFAALFQGSYRSMRIALLDLSVGWDRLPELFALPDDALSHVQEIRMVTDINSSLLPSRTPSFIRHTRYLRRGARRLAIHTLRRVTFSWGQIRHLDCYSWMTAADWLDLLSQMVSLEECRLYVVNGGSNDLVFRRKEVMFPNLQVFVVNGKDAEDALTTIIKLISAPGVKKLVIEGTLNLGNEIVTILGTRFNLSQLEEIDFCKLSGNIPFDMLLREATSMRCVVLTQGRSLEKSFLSGLAGGLLGPCLESIEIPRSCEAQEIFDMVEARRRRSESSDNHGSQKITPFKYVRFWSGGDRTDFAEKIDAFMALGVEIVINDYGVAPEPKPERWCELIHPVHISDWYKL
ncbi:hypothetical protein AX17_004348 [Amanita inopinata Kibby_2008]|nr:hypothetical protein AX17_004348 [Amanita inopinata Kibby_2008]